MYDLDGNNYISRDELLAVLHMMVGANISEDQVRSQINKRQMLQNAFHLSFIENTPQKNNYFFLKNSELLQ